MRHYKKFYEVGINKYHYLQADDELFIATESFINIGKKKPFKKNEQLTQGLKLLKVTPVLTILFIALSECKLLKDDDEFDDMKEYEVIDSKLLKKDIKDFFNDITSIAIKDIEEKKKESLEDLEKSNVSKEEKEKIKNNIIAIYDDFIKKQEESNPLNFVNLDYEKDSSCDIIKIMNKGNIKHLYSEKINSFAKSVYLFDNDKFGTITIYKVSVVKDVVKSIESYIYNRDIISKFLEVVENNDK